MPELEVLSALIATIYDTALDPQAWPAAAPTSPPTNPFASTSALDLHRTAVDPRTRPQPGALPRDSPSEGQNPRQRRARAEKDPGINPPSLTGQCCMGPAQRCVDASLGVQNLSTDSRPRRPVADRAGSERGLMASSSAASQSSLTSSARKRLSAALPARRWPRSPSPTPSTSA